jgi:hypothetical protein
MSGRKIISFVIRLALIAVGLYVIYTWYLLSVHSPERALSASTIILRAAILAGLVGLIAIIDRFGEGDS